MTRANIIVSNKQKSDMTKNLQFDGELESSGSATQLSLRTCFNKIVVKDKI